MSDHRWVRIERERQNEISLSCSCGLQWKHLPLRVGQHAVIPECPDTGSTGQSPTDEGQHT
jgi:hypothetical protein